MHMVRRRGSTTRTISRAASRDPEKGSKMGNSWSKSRSFAARARDSVRLAVCLVFPYIKRGRLRLQNAAFSWCTCWSLPPIAAVLPSHRTAATAPTPAPVASPTRSRAAAPAPSLNTRCSDRCHSEPGCTDTPIRTEPRPHSTAALAANPTARRPARSNGSRSARRPTWTRRQRLRRWSSLRSVESRWFLTRRRCDLCREDSLSKSQPFPRGAKSNRSSSLGRLDGSPSNIPFCPQIYIVGPLLVGVQLGQHCKRVQ